MQVRSFKDIQPLISTAQNYLQVGNHGYQLPAPYSAHVHRDGICDQPLPHLNATPSKLILDYIESLPVQWYWIGHVEWSGKARGEALGIFFGHLGIATRVRCRLDCPWTV